jgi:hypothetical protein
VSFRFCWGSRHGGTKLIEERAGFVRFFDLQNQVKVDSAKLARIGEYESRIEALTKTLAIWFVLLAFGRNSTVEDLETDSVSCK